MKTQYCDEIVLTDFEAEENLEQEFLAGLSKKPKTLPCKFFYDERGSKLFDQICELDEYYPTRTENRILSENIDEIASHCGSDCLLVELGSGNSSKTRLLLKHLDDVVAYVPLDISREHLLSAATRLSEDFCQLEVLPVCADYNSPLTLPVPKRIPQRTIIFFPGSTIGNFEPAKAKRFLEQIGSRCGEGDGLLIGVDLVKEKAILERAYNDAKGVTATFNLNLLHRANRELGANFRVNQFQHQAIYNEGCRRVEMHLVSFCQQEVRISGQNFQFEKNERIITEYSYKYGTESFRQLASTAGWRPLRTWTDKSHLFSVHYLQFRSRLRSSLDL